LLTRAMSSRESGIWLQGVSQHVLAAPTSRRTQVEPPLLLQVLVEVRLAQRLVVERLVFPPQPREVAARAAARNSHMAVRRIAVNPTASLAYRQD